MRDLAEKFILNSVYTGKITDRMSVCMYASVWLNIFCYAVVSSHFDYAYSFIRTVPLNLVQTSHSLGTERQHYKTIHYVYENLLHSMKERDGSYIHFQNLSQFNAKF